MNSSSSTNIPSSNGENEETENDFVSIMSIVNESAARLTHQNPLLPSSDFNLFDSMSGLEVGDPKMDSCEIPISYYSSDSFPVSDANDNVTKTVPPRKAPTQLKDPVSPLPWNDLNLNDARILLLEMMTRFESLLDGSTVAESLFTCFYAHDGILRDMTRILFVEGEDTTLSASVVGAQWTVYASTLLMVKTSDMIRTIVTHADIYEEEDFTVNKYSFRFFEDFQSLSRSTRDKAHEFEDILEVVDKAIELIKNADAEGGVQESRDVICHILDFQSNFFKNCRSLSKLTKDNVITSVNEAKQRVSSGLENVDKLIHILKLSGTKKDCEDHSDENQVLKDDGTHEKDSVEIEDSIIFQTFDPFVNRHLLGNAPVRKVKFKNPLEALQCLRKIFSEMDTAVCNILLKGTTLARIRVLLQMISQASINVLSRSLIVLNLYFDDLLMGQHLLGILIAKHMHLKGVPESITGTDYGIKYLHRLGKPTYDTLKVLLLGRNRQRAFMDGIHMFQEWETLRTEAAVVDHCFQKEFGVESLYVTNYILSMTLELMEHHLAIGIELGLFTGHYHLGVAYWYWDFLLSTKLNIDTGMHESMLKRKAMESMLQDKRKKSSKHKKSCVKDALLETPEMMEDRVGGLYFSLKRLMCRGLVRFIAALNQAEILSQPSYKFTTHEIIFQKRFQPFSAIRQPPPLTYDDYQRGTDFMSVQPEELIASATECFKSARTVLENIGIMCEGIDTEYRIMTRSDQMKITRICVSNSIFLMKLGQLGSVKKANQMKVSIDKVTHPGFCSISFS